MKNGHLQKRIYGLDIMRAMAIIYVMLSHGYEYSYYFIDIKYYKWFTTDGVGLFFVLSGFLIGGILLKMIEEQPFTTSRLLHFWTRRWFRTLPNYYLVLAILSLCYYWVHHRLPPHLGQYITFTQCFAWPHPLFFAEAWSLPVEEWFYLLVPAGLFTILHFSKGSRKPVLPFILLVLAGVTLVRTVKVMQHDYLIDGNLGAEIGKVVITRMDSIMYGVFGAWMCMYKPVVWAKYKNRLFILGLAILVACNVNSPFFYNYIIYSATAIGALCLLPKLSSVTTGKGVVYKAFTFISIISYSMYLTNHMMVQRAIMPALMQVIHIDPATNAIHAMLAFILFWLLTIGISYLLYKYWERPVMQLREKFKPGTERNVRYE